MNDLVICHDKDGVAFEVPRNELIFRPSVYGIVIRDDQVLLFPQWDGWDIPGGGIHLGETIHDALIREFREETGLTIEPGRLLHVKDDFYRIDHGKQRNLHSILMVYACSNPVGEISTDNFDAHEKTYAHKAEWVPLKDVPSLKFYNSFDMPALLAKATTGNEW